MIAIYYDAVFSYFLVCYSLCMLYQKKNNALFSLIWCCYYIYMVAFQKAGALLEWS